ncbi:MAG: insulinase family protein [Paludibacteraceae bacterium]|nr:insulinase family protein [Paludibacteraceae bacterium]
MKKILSVMLIALMSVVNIIAAELPKNFTMYTLDNGLTVYLWEDKTQADVTGYVAVRAGALDEPVEYTGLAHYLEHMLFKGTQTIGSLDWEKEKPLYEEIIKLYDEFSDSTDPERRQELTKLINEKSMEAAQYTLTDDFSNLIESMGGEGLNAFTSYDMTCYHNSFPGYEMEKWLTIYTDRLINPVFRSFQAELENVFEEYNMYQDEMQAHQQNFVSEKLYQGHPYARDVIGTPEHLKNPRLSKIIEFYNTWYVPNNMALILVGNFDAEKTKPMIAKTFGRLERKPLPERTVWPQPSFEGNPKYEKKCGYYPQIIWAYKGVPENHPDALALEFVTSLLNNSMNTGLFDKLNMDGVVSYVGAGVDSRRDMGMIEIYAVPYFDVNQQSYESNKATEVIVQKEINKLRTGQIEDWMVDALKKEYSMTMDMAFESSDAIMSMLVSTFIYQKDPKEMFSIKEKVMAFTKEDIARVAKKYFDAEHVTFNFEEGDPKKHKLAKPEIKPLESPKGVETEYSKNFKKLPVGEVEEKYNNFEDVKIVSLDDHIKLYYTENNKNDIFSLTLRYGIGTEKKPKLEYAVNLMNTAGVMPNTEPQQFRRQLAELGGVCGYSVSDSYFYASIEGDENNLASICQLVQRQMLMPKLDQQQLDNIKGSEFSGRMMLPRQNGAQASALLSYVIYGKKSPYLDVVPFMDVYQMSIPQLLAEFQSATEYDLQIHYCGAKPLEEVKTTLLGNLPLKEGMRASESPIVRERQTYDKQTIYFLPNSDIQQARIYFYIDGDPYDISQDVGYEAFDQYFSGGFSGLVMNEIREKRSMAYTAYGYMSTPPVPEKKSYFIGYVGAQNDKVADAIDVYMDLLKNMPLYPDRIDNIKTYLRQTSLTAKPSMRSKSMVYESWQRLGYKEDPAKVHMADINNLKFEQIVDFYNAHIKGKPITIVVMGDPKLINLKQIKANHGKYQKLSKGRLFAPLDLDF